MQRRASSRLLVRWRAGHTFRSRVASSGLHATALPVLEYATQRSSGCNHEELFGVGVAVQARHDVVILFDQQVMVDAAGRPAGQHGDYHDDVPLSLSSTAARQFPLIHQTRSNRSWPPVPKEARETSLTILWSMDTPTPPWLMAKARSDSTTTADGGSSEPGRSSPQAQAPASICGSVTRDGARSMDGRVEGPHVEFPECTGTEHSSAPDAAVRHLGRRNPDWCFFGLKRLQRSYYVFKKPWEQVSAVCRLDEEGVGGETEAPIVADNSVTGSQFWNSRHRLNCGASHHVFPPCPSKLPRGALI